MNGLELVPNRLNHLKTQKRYSVDKHLVRLLFDVCHRVVSDLCGGLSACKQTALLTNTRNSKHISPNIFSFLVWQHKSHQFDDFIQKIVSNSHASHFKSLLLLLLLLYARVKPTSSTDRENLHETESERAS